MVAAAILMVAATSLMYSDKTITTETALDKAISNADLKSTNITDSTIKNPLYLGRGNADKEAINQEVENKNTINIDTALEIEDASSKHTGNPIEEIANSEKEYTYEREYALAEVLTRLGAGEANSTISQEDISILESLNTQDLDYDYIKTYIDSSLF